MKWMDSGGAFLARHNDFFFTLINYDTCLKFAYLSPYNACTGQLSPQSVELPLKTMLYFSLEEVKRRSQWLLHTKRWQMFRTIVVRTQLGTIISADTHKNRWQISKHDWASDADSIPKNSQGHFPALAFLENQSLSQLALIYECHSNKYESIAELSAEFRT